MSWISKITGLDKQKEAINPLNEAAAGFDALKVPTLESLQYTPELQDTINQEGTAFEDISLDPTGRDAEIAALKKLQGISEAGGNDAEYQAAVQKAKDEMGTALRGQREAVMQEAAQRGTSNAGTTLAARLSGISDVSRGANAASVTAAADAEKRALDALANSANIGSNVTSQDYKQASDKAAAIDAINQYNAQNAQNVQAQNVGAKNTAAQYNAAQNQTLFENELAKQQGKAGIASNKANAQLQQGQSQTGLIGSLIGAGGSIIAGLGGKKGSIGGAEGGRVNGDAPIDGDDERNDIVPALLSPGEIVIPRSIAKHPDAPDLAKEFVKHLPKEESKRIAPSAIRSVLKALTEIQSECEGGAV